MLFISVTCLDPGVGGTSCHLVTAEVCILYDRVMGFNATFNKLYLGSQLYRWGKPEYPEKTNNLSQVTDKLYHIT